MKRRFSLAFVSAAFGVCLLGFAMSPNFGWFIAMEFLPGVNLRERDATRGGGDG